MKRFLQRFAKRIVRVFFASVHTIILIVLAGIVTGKCLEASGTFAALSAFPMWNLLLLVIALYLAFVFYTNYVKLAHEKQPLLVRLLAAKGNWKVVALIAGIVTGKMLELFGVFSALQASTAWYPLLAILLAYAVVVTYSLLIKFSRNDSNGSDRPDQYRKHNNG